MSRFDDIISGLQQKVTVPDEVRRKYSNTLASLPDKPGKIPQSFSRRRMFPIAVAATLALGVVGVSASSYIRWSRGLEAGLQVTPEQQAELEEKQITSFVEQSVTQGDVTVTAYQSIVDRHYALLAFRVEGFTVEDGEQPGFAETTLQVEGNENASGFCSGDFYDGLITGNDGMAIHDDGTPFAEDDEFRYTMEDGSLEYQVKMMSDQPDSFINKSIHVELKGLGIYPGKAEDVEVKAEGEWIFDWTLTGSDEVKTYELNAPLEGSEATILRAELSPISIALTYDFPYQEETEMAVDENGEEVTYTTWAEPPYFTGVRLKDGTIYTGLGDGGASNYSDDDMTVYETTQTLSRIIDVDQVESLLFIKHPWQIGESPSEDDLYIVPVEG